MQKQQELRKRKTFALGYSYVGVSLISYFLTLFCTTGILNTFRASFAEKSGIAATTLLSVVTISGILSNWSIFSWAKSWSLGRGSGSVPQYP